MTAVACGSRHTCSVSCTGQVFCWGWDLHGQCGQGRSTVVVDQPQAVSALGGLKVVGIAAGLAHTVVCTDSGDVYSWGWNSDGQLGLGNDQNRSLPELVAATVLEDVHIDKVMCFCRCTVSDVMQSSVIDCSKAALHTCCVGRVKHLLWLLLSHHVNLV